MTSTPTTAWTEVAEKIEALALKLKLHAEEELASAGVDLPDVADKLSAAITGAAEAIGDAVKDDAIRQDLRDAASSLADAVVTTFHAVKARVDT